LISSEKDCKIFDIMLRRDWFKTVISGLSSSHFSNNISW